MSGGSLRDFTVKRAGSSGGAFEIGSTTLWNRTLLLTSAPGRWLVAAEGEDEKGSRIGVVSYHDAVTGNMPNPTFNERLVCYVVLAQLPDFAVADALSTLTDIWSDSQPRPAVATIAPPRVGRGKVVGFKRPDPILIVEG